jgi:hypothetical protein
VFYSVLKSLEELVFEGSLETAVAGVGVCGLERDCLVNIHMKQ